MKSSCWVLSSFLFVFTIATPPVFAQTIKSGDQGIWLFSWQEATWDVDGQGKIDVAKNPVEFLRRKIAVDRERTATSAAPQDLDHIAGFGFYAADNMLSTERFGPVLIALKLKPQQSITILPNEPDLVNAILRKTKEVPLILYNYLGFSVDRALVVRDVESLDLASEVITVRKLKDGRLNKTTLPSPTLIRSASIPELIRQVAPLATPLALYFSHFRQIGAKDHIDPLIGAEILAGVGNSNDQTLLSKFFRGDITEAEYPSVINTLKYYALIPKNAPTADRGNVLAAVAAKRQTDHPIELSSLHAIVDRVFDISEKQSLGALEQKAKNSCKYLEAFKNYKTGKRPKTGDRPFQVEPEI